MLLRDPLLAGKESQDPLFESTVADQDMGAAEVFNRSKEADPAAGPK
jgi:hypothetical protein